MSSATPDPYRPPAAPLADAPAGEFRWTAALAGGAIGLGFVYAAWSILGPVFKHWFLSNGVEAGRVFSTMMQSTAYNLVGHLLKIIGIAVGAVAAAQLAGSRPFAHAVASVVVTYIAVIGNFFNALPFPLWSQALSVLIPVPSALLGAWLYTSRKTRL